MVENRGTLMRLVDGTIRWREHPGKSLTEPILRNQIELSLQIMYDVIFVSHPMSNLGEKDG
jgi:hypothetical protein